MSAFTPRPSTCACSSHRTGLRKTVDKPLKRVRYLSEGLLRRALSGQGLPEFLPEPDEQSGKPAEDQHAVRLQNGALCLLQEEVCQLPCRLRLNTQGGKRSLRLLIRQNVWHSERTPRVTVDRINSSSNIFHAGRTRFTPGCGLWFGVQWRSPETLVADQSALSYRDALEQGLAFLGEEGIGGERNAGYGAFAPKWGEEFHLRDPRPGGVAWLLSRYLPAPTEILGMSERRARGIQSDSRWRLGPCAGGSRPAAQTDPSSGRRQPDRVAVLFSGRRNRRPAASIHGERRRFPPPGLAQRPGCGRGTERSSGGLLMADYTIYDLTVSVLTPLHIGTGRELLNQYDYAIHNGRTWRLNEGALLDAQDVEDAEPWPPQLAQSLRRRSLLEAPHDYRPDNGLFRYVLRGTPRSNAQGAQLREQIKDAFDRPYLPGSSFKGALRTALAWNVWQQRDMRPEISKIDRRRQWAAQTYEKEIFGRDPNNDSLRALQVSDSAPVDSERLLILNARVMNRRGSLDAPIEMEAIAPDTQLSLTLKVDGRTLLRMGCRQQAAPERTRVSHGSAVRRPKPQPGPRPPGGRMVQRDRFGPADCRVLSTTGRFPARRSPLSDHSGLGNRLDEQDLRPAPAVRL